MNFIYNSYSVTERGFSFEFFLNGTKDGDIVFHPAWEVLSDIKIDVSDPLIHRAVFNIGMAELASYWKCACPCDVSIQCGSLDEYETVWWKKLYYHGLGEFFYRNNLTPDKDNFMHISADRSYTPLTAAKSLHGNIIPIGGGKDSIVTLELLRNMDNLCYIINPMKHTLGSAAAAGYGDNGIIKVKRTIDSELLRLNKSGYLNGHTPLSAVIAFSAFMFAYVTGRKYVVLSNESSANESYVTGTDINHQYSKSTAFEYDFREYIAHNFNYAPEYFSFLRPLNELRIAELFVKEPKYFDVFMSCNLGTKTDKWCGECAKCLYTYVLLAAFLPNETLIKIFGKDMLHDKKYEQMLQSLINPDLDKPFECVGTREEICLALNIAKSGNRDAKIPYYYDNNNYLPKEFKEILHEHIRFA